MYEGEHTEVAQKHEAAGTNAGCEDTVTQIVLGSEISLPTRTSSLPDLIRPSPERALVTTGVCTVGDLSIRLQLGSGTLVPCQDCRRPPWLDYHLERDVGR